MMWQNARTQWAGALTGAPSLCPTRFACDNAHERPRRVTQRPNVLCQQPSCVRQHSANESPPPVSRGQNSVAVRATKRETERYRVCFLASHRRSGIADGPTGMVRSTIKTTIPKQKQTKLSNNKTTWRSLFTIVYVNTLVNRDGLVCASWCHTYMQVCIYVYIYNRK